MTDIWNWLIGVHETADATSATSWRLELTTWPQGGWSVACAAAVVAALAGVWWLYRKEGRRLSVGVRLILSALRVIALACVALMLLELVLVTSVVERTPAQVAVLVDTSQSMNLRDPYTDEAAARATAVGLQLTDDKGDADLAGLRQLDRLTLARRALDKLVDPLSKDRELTVYQFDGELTPLESPADVADLAARGEYTGVGRALQSVLAAHRGQPLAGVLLVTDGRSNTGADARRVAAEAGKRAVTVHTLAVGTDEGPSNAIVQQIDASPIVFVRDSTEISVLYTSTAMKGRTAAVTLDVRRNDGQWQELHRQDVVLGEDAVVQRLTVPFVPASVGRYDFRARISDAGAELTDADNVATTNMKVARQSIRVLVIAGYPAPEFQFLRNALLRDEGLEFASWLQSADKNYEHVGHRPIRRLPVDNKELDRYDVVVLFDPNMRELGPRWPEMLEKFVGNSGGGLIYIAGELNSPSLFGASTSGSNDGTYVDTAWLRILPVSVDPGLYHSSAEVKLSSQEIWNLELTPEGQMDSIFQFASARSRNSEIMASLPGMYWHFPVTRARPGATVLARHGDPRMRNNFGRHVLMAIQRYGPGQTMFIGFDSTHRWRYLDEAHFDGFWARLIDRLGRSKALGGRYPFMLTTEKSVYGVGERVVVRAILRDSENLSSDINQLVGEVELAGGQVLPIELLPRSDDPSIMEATFAVDEAGPCVIRVTPATSQTAVEGSLRPATLHLKVEPPRQELENPKLDRSLLQDVARASGGRYFTLADYQKLPAALTVTHFDRVIEHRDELWDAPILFITLIAVLTGEWFLRKRYRMA